MLLPCGLCVVNAAGGAWVTGLCVGLSRPCKSGGGVLCVGLSRPCKSGGGVLTVAKTEWQIVIDFLLFRDFLPFDDVTYWVYEL